MRGDGLTGGVEVKEGTEAEGVKDEDTSGSTTMEVDVTDSTPIPLPLCGQTEEQEIFEPVSPVMSTGIGDLYDDTVMGLLGPEDDGDLMIPPSQSSCKSGLNKEGREDEESCFSPGLPIGIIKLSPAVSRSGSAGSNSDVMDCGADDGGSLSQEFNGYGYGGGGVVSSKFTMQRRFAVYVGNLTWWTTHEDIREAVKTVGIADLLDVKIFECRSNGQSKGFSLLTFGSEGSVRTVEQLEKVMVHGRAPVVKSDSKASALFFDSQSRTRPPIIPQTDQPFGFTPSRGGPVTPTGLGRHQYRNPNPFHKQFGSSYRGSSGVGPRPSWGPSPGQNRFLPRVPSGSYIPGGNRGPPPPQLPQALPTNFATVPPPNFEDWRNPSPHVQRAHVNPAFFNRNSQPEWDCGPGDDWSSYNSQYQLKNDCRNDVGMEEPLFTSTPLNSPPYSQIESVSCDVNQTFTSTTHQEAMNKYSIKSNSKHPGSVGKSMSSPNCSQLDTEELLERNHSICSQAIQRAVNDASNGEFASAIETLVTAISLIKGSKVSRERRCQVLISSLHDTLGGIEHRSYGRNKKPERTSGSTPYGKGYRSSSPYKVARDSSCERGKRSWEERDRASVGSRSSHAVELMERDRRGTKFSRMDYNRKEHHHYH